MIFFRGSNHEFEFDFFSGRIFFHHLQMCHLKKRCDKENEGKKGEIINLRSTSGVQQRESSQRKLKLKEKKIHVFDSMPRIKDFTFLSLDQIIKERYFVPCKILP